MVTTSGTLLSLFLLFGIDESVSQAVTARAQRVFVAGGVVMPRPVAASKPRELWGLIVEAGGISRIGDPHRVRIESNDRSQSIRSILIDALQLRERGMEHLVAPGSTVIVEEMRISDAGLQDFERRVHRFDISPAQARELIEKISAEGGDHGDSPAFILGDYYGFSDGPYNSSRSGWVVHGFTGEVRPLKDGGIEYLSN